MSTDPKTRSARSTRSTRSARSARSSSFKSKTYHIYFPNGQYTLQLSCLAYLTICLQTPRRARRARRARALGALGALRARPQTLAPNQLSCCISYYLSTNPKAKNRVLQTDSVGFTMRNWVKKKAADWCDHISVCGETNSLILQFLLCVWEIALDILEIALYILEIALYMLEIALTWPQTKRPTDVLIYIYIYIYYILFYYIILYYIILHG